MAKTIMLVVLTAIVAGGIVYLLKPATQVHTSVTVEQIKAIAKLGTAECTVSAVRDEGFESTGVLGLSDYVVVIVRGKVTGSVDMEKATVDVNEASDDRHVSINFGPGSIEVSNVEHDPSHPDRVISAHEKMDSPFWKGKPASQNQIERMKNEARVQLRLAALGAGIVERTKQNAQVVLSTFVGQLGYRANVTFDPKAYEPSASLPGWLDKLMQH